MQQRERGGKEGSSTHFHLTIWKFNQWNKMWNNNYIKAVINELHHNLFTISDPAAWHWHGVVQRRNSLKYIMYRQRQAVFIWCKHSYLQNLSAGNCWYVHKSVFCVGQSFQHVIYVCVNRLLLVETLDVCHQTHSQSLAMMSNKISSLLICVCSQFTHNQWQDKCFTGLAISLRWIMVWNEKLCQYFE